MSNLVLTRKIGEAIICELPDGETLKVTVIDSTPARARLSFEAPRRVRIVREEIADKPYNRGA